MASVRRRSPRTKSKDAPARSLPSRTTIALIVYCLLIVTGPLAFGAVDRITQVGLLLLFAVGLYARPAVMLPLSRWGNRLVIALLAILFLKEFAPAAWFGSVQWRTALVGGFNLPLPWTHNPEPARAFDSMLALTAGALWFAWVRTLASDRECRPVLVWALVAAGAVITAVAYSTRSIDPHAIYGLRYTPGWTGFGPFPNRNHTADLLAVALVLGTATTAWEAARKHWPGVVAGSILSGIIFCGLLATQSRGGLLAAGFGLGFYVLLVFLKLRNRRVIGIAAAVVAMAGAMAALFGAEVFGRFTSHEGGQVSTNMRLHIWQDALRLWADAPIFGHGLRTFPQVIGFYQTLRLEDQVILHPESSWLQWLTELGLVPVLMAAGGLSVFLFNQTRTAFARQRGFYLRAGAFAAFSVLVFHSAIDVPAHRWGTLAFALAALALGCPLRLPTGLPAGFSRTAFFPVAVAVFWALPFFIDWPLWSPLTASRLIDRNNRTSAVPLEQLEKVAGYFPLDAQIQQSLGIRQVHLLGTTKPTEWQRRFGIASALVPTSWNLCAMQARTVASVSPGLAVGYWQQALERCDLHREEVLGIGVRETAKYPSTGPLWGRYVEANPELLLAYAQSLPDEDARYYFDLWWEQRALAAELKPAELEIFYRQGARWGQRPQFDDWMRVHAAWKDRDYRLWANLLHQWKDDQRAFELLAEHIPEPEFPRGIPSISRDQLEMKWRITPRNVVNAQQLAMVLRAMGDTAQSDEIIMAVARQDSAPQWFMVKAGYIHTRLGQPAEGVDLLLRGSK